MRLPKLRWLLLAPLLLFAVFYAVLALMLAFDDETLPPLTGEFEPPRRIAIFGASGTAGDGILKAALADSRIESIEVITRRATPRIDAGVQSGKVRMTLHMDYLDYSSLTSRIADVDAVYWAIGTSSIGVDEETYGLIHVDFPAAFLTEWLRVTRQPAASFHYISSSDISADSRAMWAREKVRAENTLFDLAQGSAIRVIAYRPDYIGPTSEEAHLGQTMVYGFFAPVGAAVKATAIGEAMLEVSARGAAFGNGDKLSTRGILLHADAYRRRSAAITASTPAPR